ncbi:hypothetical protein [endosymbiont GvMRE of Glomus versiforme]|uniref:hypothetical protein n=1 Tax=endosymbiont GvMRE of Glomus versiforme TaxID=2039283 RepID=UPI000ED3E136|nr:hypothetical protein [endosymbiont GvMRE of Glomus versiforme]RHZ37250.1 Single-stranded DNA-binding protein [endosymbiont GvMRE of Glomus versiforme]RHZ37450.1 Single-stranded DNA-binding protein [endosymbiont GvMRE of Glomus versiforme]
MKEQIIKNNGVLADHDPQRLNQTITGTLTSRIEKREKDNETYYYGFFSIENQTQEIPVVFKGRPRGYGNDNDYKPNIPKGSQVQLKGNWANSNSSRPSFTCHHYQILSNPPPLTTKSLQKQIQPLLSIAWEQRKSWTQTTEFLTKKQEQLRELERYQKYPSLLQAYLDLKAFYYSNEYYKQKLVWDGPTTFLEKIASELEDTERRIKAIQAQDKANQRIRELEQKISDLEKQNQDLDYLLTSGKNSEIIKKLQTKIQELNKKTDEIEKEVNQ